MTSDQIRDAWRSVARRPKRSALTALGVCLGIAAIVAIAGLTASGSLQVSRRFDAFTANAVTIDIPHAQHADTPAAIAHRLATLDGVIAAGIYTNIAADTTPLSIRTARQTESRNVPLIVADSSGLLAAKANIIAGAIPTHWAEAQNTRIALLGQTLARDYHVTPTAGEQTIYLNGQPFDVVGVVADANNTGLLTTSVIVNPNAVGHLDPNIEPRSLLVRVKEGTAQPVAQRAALLVYPEEPNLVSIQLPPQPEQLRGRITADTRDLIVALAAVTLAAAAIGITNTMLIAVWERRAEIGIRRSMGATKASIATLFLIEAAFIGTVGGLAGTTIGILAGSSLSAIRGWAYALPPAAPLATLLGATVGTLAGVYPAIRATRVDPIESLRA
ncbi:MAG: ABC transporter permease [Acidimicrobiia bacterium]